MSFRFLMSYTGLDGPWASWFGDHARTIGIEPYLYGYDQRPGCYISKKVQSEIKAKRCGGSSLHDQQSGLSLRTTGNWIRRRPKQAHFFYRATGNRPKSDGNVDG